MTDYSGHTDKDLFLQIASNDEGAFRALFHRYQPQLMPFINKLVQYINDPREVLQEVFLKIWQRRHRLNNVDNPKGYIIQIVSNEAANLLHREARQNQLLKKAMQRKEAQPLTPEQLVALKEIASQVNEAIEKLPKRRRQVYIMSRDQQMTVAEIASELGISESTVINQLVKALKSIRKHIQTNGLSAFLTFPVIF